MSFNPYVVWTKVLACEKCVFSLDHPMGYARGAHEENSHIVALHQWKTPIGMIREIYSKRRNRD